MRCALIFNEASKMKVHGCIVFLFWNVCSIYCSVGDKSRDFISCTNRCHSLTCSDTRKVDLSLSLRLTGWTCFENCQYHCMHEVTAQDVRLNRPIRQFFGKWPFVRVLGIQEPASTIFSALNGIAVVIGYVKFYQEAPSSYPFHGILFLQFIVNINTWIWSTVFHTRDLYWTEKLDYFSAAALIVVGLIVQFVRISGSAMHWQVLYGFFWTALYCCHVTYLSVFRFDYGYNMMASVVAGVVYSAVWMIWCFKNIYERPYVWKCSVTVMATTCFVLLELLDFAPLWWIFDAHSLWHLSTVPLPLLWYSFLSSDARYEVRYTTRKQI